MNFDDLKRLAISLLQNYETAWQENAALKTLLQNYPMPDGSKGVPLWQEIFEDWLEQGRSRAHERFAPLFEQIQSARQESDLLELLRKVPPTGRIQ